MTNNKTHCFCASLEIIGINPFVFVPDTILQEVFLQAGRDKNPIPIKGTVNNNPFKQTLVKYRGAWRLYINMAMLKNSPKRIGEEINITLQYDHESREVQPPEKFVKALNAAIDAKKVFDSLTPSSKSEIVRYLANLKTEVALERNIIRAINYLLGNERFVGRDKP